MKQFPASSSVLSDQHLGKFLQKRYAFNEPVHCLLLKTFVNDTYLVEAGQNKFMLRVYTFQWRSEKEITEEVNLINHLKGSGISVSYPIADRKGNFVQELSAPEGKRYAVLFSYAEGEKRYDASPSLHHALGVMMAHMHLLMENMHLERVNYSPHTLLVRSFEKYRHFFHGEPPEFAIIHEALRKCMADLSEANTSAMRKGAVHLDIWADNLHIDEADHPTLFDFDFCGNGWLCLDIAFYLLSLFSSFPDEKEYTERAAGFLKGYSSVTPILPEEKRLLPVIGTSLYIFYLGVQYDRFKTVFFNAEHLRRYIHLRIRKWHTAPPELLVPAFD